MAASSLLIVDDEQQLVNIIMENLEPLGVSVTAASDGFEALNRILDNRFDAVLCDVRMPNLDGLSLLQKVRELGMDTPFVFLSGFAEVEQLRSALRLGATDYLEKPWSISELLRAIKSAMEIGHCQKHLRMKIAASIPIENTQALSEVEDYWKKLNSLRARR